MTRLPPGVSACFAASDKWEAWGAGDSWCQHWQFAKLFVNTLGLGSWGLLLPVSNTAVAICQTFCQHNPNKWAWGAMAPTPKILYSAAVAANLQNFLTKRPKQIGGLFV